jgi:hypothetical protein
MLVDGAVRIITYLEWATQKLSAEDLVKFTAAQVRNENIWQTAQAEGQVVVNAAVADTPYVLDVQFNDSFIVNDPEYVVFMNQMLADPDVTWPGAGRRPAFY